MTSTTETMCELNLYIDSVTGYYDNEYYDSEYYGMEYYGNQTIMTIDELSIDLDVIYNNNRTDVTGTDVLDTSVMGTSVLDTSVMGTSVLDTSVMGTSVMGTDVMDTSVLSPITERILTQT